MQQAITSKDLEMEALKANQKQQDQDLLTLASEFDELKLEKDSLEKNYQSIVGKLALS